MDDYGEKLKDWIFGKGTAVVEAGFLYYGFDFGKWHRSRDRKDTNYSPYGSYMMNKKWTLEEEFNNHMMRFQQVKMQSFYFIKLHFHIPGWIDSHCS